MTPPSKQPSPSPSASGQEQEKTILTLAKGASIALVGRVVGRFLMLAGQATLAQLLGPSQYGLFSIGWSMLQVSANTGRIGLPQAIIRFGAEYWQRDEKNFRAVVQQVILLSLLVSGLMGATFYFFAPEVAQWFGKPDLVQVVRGTAIALVLLVMLKVLSAATRVSRRVQYSVVVEDIVPGALVLAGALLFIRVLGRGLGGAMTSLVMAYGLALVLVLVFVARLYPRVFLYVRARSFIREILAFSLPAALAGVFGISTRWVPRLLLGYFRPEAEVGLYQAASQIASLSTIILIAINAILVPMVSFLYHRGMMDDLDELYKVGTKWGVYLSIPLVIVMMMFPSDVMALVYGSAYRGGALMLIVLALGQLISTMSGAVAPLHLMTGHQTRWMALTAGALAITLLMDFLLIPRWGNRGAAVADMLGQVTLNIGGLLQIKHLTGLWPYDRRYWKGSMAALLAMLAAAIPTFWPFGSILLKLGLASFLSAVTFAISILLLGLDDEDKTFLKAVRARLAHQIVRS